MYVCMYVCTVVLCMYVEVEYSVVTIYCIVQPLSNSDIIIIIIHILCTCGQLTYKYM